MDIYKQICAKLVKAWDDTADGKYKDFGRTAFHLVAWARAALAEPEPESPTNEELYDLMYKFTIGTGHGERLDEIGFARAVLARWGNHPGSPDGSTPPS